MFHLLIHVFSGFFTNNEMQKWYATGYFGDRQLIKSSTDDGFHTLLDYVNMCNGSPFISDVYASDQPDFFDEIPRQELTPIPVGIPLTAHQPMMIRSNVPAQSYVPSIIHPNSSTMTPYSYPYMVVPPGMGTYNESQVSFQRDGYGMNERDNPSSSSVSETPDSERCLQVS